MRGRAGRHGHCVSRAAQHRELRRSVSDRDRVDMKLTGYLRRGFLWSWSVFRDPSGRRGGGSPQQEILGVPAGKRHETYTFWYEPI